MKWIALVVFLGIAVGMMTVPGCQTLTRSLFNTDLEGEQAPALTSAEWVFAEGEKTAPTKQWMVLAFFLPT